MKVTQRLYLAVLPSAVGIVTVSALGYWGRYTRQVPELFLGIAFAATAVTLVMSWMNVRYVARRVDRLSQWRTKSASASDAVFPQNSAEMPRDELDAIESVVEGLAVAVNSSQLMREGEAKAYGVNLSSYAELLLTVASSASRKMDEVRLPLHILLDNHFGELNENQEELLQAARDAAESADRELTTLHQIADVDLGRRVVRKDRIFMADLLHAIMPMIQSEAEKNGKSLLADIPPLIPPVRGDAPQLQEALLSLIRAGIRGSASIGQLRLSLSSDSGAIRIQLVGGASDDVSPNGILARRLIVANGGIVDQSHETLAISFRR